MDAAVRQKIATIFKKRYKTKKCFFVDDLRVPPKSTFKPDGFRGKKNVTRRHNYYNAIPSNFIFL
jgi:hypothetical protein